MFVLFNTIACVVLYAGILAAFLAGQKTLAIVIGCLCCIYGLAALIPGLAVSVRRLHDINKSGWWILISLVPGVGGLILLILDCIEGDPATISTARTPNCSHSQRWAKTPAFGITSDTQLPQREAVPPGPGSAICYNRLALEPNRASAVFRLAQQSRISRSASSLRFTPAQFNHQDVATKWNKVL